jgi:hypothetical protein
MNVCFRPSGYCSSSLDRGQGTLADERGCGGQILDRGRHQVTTVPCVMPCTIWTAPESAARSM